MGGYCTEINMHTDPQEHFVPQRAVAGNAKGIWVAPDLHQLTAPLLVFLLFFRCGCRAVRGGPAQPRQSAPGDSAMANGMKCN